MSRTIIAIPSLGRAEWMLTSDNTALHNISSEYMKNTLLVVRENEVRSYEPVAKKFGCDIKTIPASLYEGKTYGIRETRDFLFDAFLPFCDHLLMIEDDMRIDIKKDDLGHYKKMDDVETQFPLCMSLLETADMDVPVTSVLSRLFCISKAGKRTIMNGDAIQLTMFYSKFFRERPEFRYANGPVWMEDFTLLLKIMVAGRGVKIFCDFVKQDVLNAKRTVVFGGCNAIGRKLIDIDRAAMALAEAYPEYVEAYAKVRPSTWGDEPTIGVKIKYSRLASLYKGPKEKM